MWRLGGQAAVTWLVIAAFTRDGRMPATVGPTDCWPRAWRPLGPVLLGAAAASYWIDLPRFARTGPWLIAVALLLGVWELVSAKLDLLPRPSSLHRNRCLKFTPMIGHVWARARCDRSCCSAPATRSARRWALSAVWRSVGRAPLGYWALPCFASSDRCPRQPGCPVTFFTFPSSWSAGVFLIALGWLSGHSVDLVRRGKR